MKSKHIVFPAILSIVALFTMGLPGALYLILTTPFFYLVDLILQTNYAPGQFKETGGVYPGWGTIIMVGIGLPLLFIPLYSYLRKKYPAKKAVLFSLGALYLVLIVVGFWTYRP